MITQCTRLDLTDLYDIRLWYQDRVECKLGSTAELTYKLDFAYDALINPTTENKIGDKETGVLDLSYAADAHKAGFEAGPVDPAGSASSATASSTPEGEGTDTADGTTGETSGDTTDGTSGTTGETSGDGGTTSPTSPLPPVTPPPPAPIRRSGTAAGDSGSDSGETGSETGDSGSETGTTDRGGAIPDAPSPAEASGIFRSFSAPGAPQGPQTEKFASSAPFSQEIS